MPEAKGFYAVGPEKAEFIRNEIKDMLNRGIIRPSVSPWAAPVVLIQKKEGTFCFCVDYRNLNAITKPDKYPLPALIHFWIVLENLIGSLESTLPLGTGKLK
jgi:hypothetical protein